MRLEAIHADGLLPTADLDDEILVVSAEYLIRTLIQRRQRRATVTPAHVHMGAGGEGRRHRRRRLSIGEWPGGKGKRRRRLQTIQKRRRRRLWCRQKLAGKDERLTI
jgi:hypothetical protein